MYGEGGRGSLPHPTHVHAFVQTLETVTVLLTQPVPGLSILQQLLQPDSPLPSIQSPEVELEFNSPTETG